MRLRWYLKSDVNFENVVFEFVPMFCVNPMEFNKRSHVRFDWLTHAVESHWMPFYITSNERIGRHIVFEGGRWDKFPRDQYVIAFQILSDSYDYWLTIDKFEFGLTEEWYVTQLKGGSSFAMASLLSTETP